MTAIVSDDALLARARSQASALRRAGPAATPFLAVSSLVALFALTPLGFIVWVGTQTGWATIEKLVFRPRILELLVNTAMLEAATLPLTILLALALAWSVERTDMPGAKLWSWLAVAPLAIPAFVHGYGWMSAAPDLNGFGGATVVSTLAYFPFLYLPVAAQLRRLDPALEEAAASLGLGPCAVFLRVALPQLRVAICGGALLVGLHLLAEYGLFVMIRFDTFTTAIVDQFQSAFNSPAANMMAGVLVLCCLALIGGETLARGGERYARLGPGAPRPPHRARLRPAAKWACLGLNALVAALAIGVPAATLLRWLALGGAAAWRGDEIVQALGTTVALALSGAVLTTLAVAPMAWLSVRAPGRLVRALEACHYYVGSLPGVVVALALVTLTVRLAPALYQTLATLIAAYVLLFLPRALVGLRASVAQAPVELEEAAMALGRTPLQAMAGVTMRLAAPGAAASAALVGLAVATELTATLMLSPNGTVTLATRFWALTSEIDYVGAAPYAFLMVAFSAPLTLLLHMHSKRTLRG
ncbi:ABC transporter permease [Methylocella sp.]|uniref:ABC transporter permease n=1 Tax=Methylocella sp. TaxID=1978226 RepID=UPI0037852940